MTAKAELKFYGKRRAIARRVKNTARKVVRILSCGHEVPEPDGGQAHNAQFAICRKCKDDEGPSKGAMKNSAYGGF